MSDEIDSPSDLTDVQHAAVAQQRYSKECGGVTWSGHRVRTDRESQGLILAALVTSQQPGFTSVDWKMADGTFATLEALDVTAMATTVGQHVQGCFARERALHDAVDAGTFTPADLLSGWPE